jgi:hypothetical protein
MAAKKSKGSPKAAGISKQLGGRSGKSKARPEIKGGPARPGPGVSKI